MPFHLKSVLESTGQWGAVRVVPEAAGTSDVTVTGTILRSTGLILAVRIRAVDSRGKVWRDEKYKREAPPGSYSDELVDSLDPYQNLYNRIANDLLASREKLKEKQIYEIRNLTRLAFAEDLAPDAFEGYTTTSKKGRVKLVRLPAEDDPMMARLDRIRGRDHMFIDTLNEHYADFYLQMNNSYDDWREVSYAEQFELRKIRRQARAQKILGGLLIIGAAAGGSAGSSAGRAARTAAAVSGALVLQEGIATGKQAKMHLAALQELAASFDSEMEPLLVEVEGRVMRLEGSAEAQYAAWRRLLGEVFASETGFATDSAGAAVPAAAGNADP